MINVDLMFVMGPTNCGKGHLIQHACKHYGAWGVQVGNLLRKKYGPAYFNGQQAPEHTRVEALNMMMDNIRLAVEKGYSLILVDGQPREPSQVDAIFDNFIGPSRDGEVYYNVFFLLLHCPDSLREQRAKERDTDPAALELSLKRMTKDIGELQKLFYEIARRGQGSRIIPVESTEVGDSFDDFYTMLNYNKIRSE